MFLGRGLPAAAGGTVKGDPGVLQFLLQLHQGGELHTVAVTASNDAGALGVQDLVVIAVKAPALAGVAQQIGPLLGPDTVVLTAMNGVPWWFLQGFGGAVAGHALQSVDPQGAIARALPASAIMGGPPL